MFSRLILACLLGVGGMQAMDPGLSPIPAFSEEWVYDVVDDLPAFACDRLSEKRAGSGSASFDAYLSNIDFQPRASVKDEEMMGDTDARRRKLLELDKHNLSRPVSLFDRSKKRSIARFRPCLIKTAPVNVDRALVKVKSCSFEGCSFKCDDYRGLYDHLVFRHSIERNTVEGSFLLCPLSQQGGCKFKVDYSEDWTALKKNMIIHLRNQHAGELQVLKDLKK